MEKVKEKKDFKETWKDRNARVDKIVKQFDKIKADFEGLKKINRQIKMYEWISDVTADYRAKHFKN